ncbi:FAD-linked oxidase [Anopheles sinensis]|uniref:FAD-linked oxidase n=1 Tax=Anopheles sinensis TaxID=74873 RepID=A0A084VJ88_ANOSI|nr:FAD-linked oxidase [Anopheles sinensis]
MTSFGARYDTHTLLSAIAAAGYQHGARCTGKDTGRKYKEPRIRNYAHHRTADHAHTRSRLQTSQTALHGTSGAEKRTRAWQCALRSGCQSRKKVGAFAVCCVQNSIRLKQQPVSGCCTLATSWFSVHHMQKELDSTVAAAFADKRLLSCGSLDKIQLAEHRSQIAVWQWFQYYKLPVLCLLLHRFACASHQAH